MSHPAADFPFPYRLTADGAQQIRDSARMRIVLC
jgi:hypothetical protein